MTAQMKITNFEAFLASVRDAERIAGDLTEPLSQIGADWMRTNQSVFQLSGPGPWVDLMGSKPRRNKKTGRFQSPNGGYKAQKLKKWGFVYPILKASGALERSLTQPGDPNSLFEIVNGKNLILGTKVMSRSGANYPFFLARGTSKMRARNYLSIPELSVARWIGILKNFIVGRISETSTSNQIGA